MNKITRYAVRTVTPNTDVAPYGSMIDDEHGKYVCYEQYEQLERQIELAFSMLSMNGVPKERASSIANGIDVLATRYRKAAIDYEVELNRLFDILGNAANPHSRQCAQNKEWLRDVAPACTCSYASTQEGQP